MKKKKCVCVCVREREREREREPFVCKKKIMNRIKKRIVNL